MKTEIMSFNGLNTIGLYAFVTDKYALIGQEVPDKHIQEIEEVLQVKTHKITIAGTSLIGVFLAGNEDVLLVPNIAFDSEIEQLKKIGINYKIIDTKYTCLGNNIILGNKKGLISTVFTDAQAKSLSKELNIELTRYKTQQIEAIGSLIAKNKEKGLISNDITDEEFEFIQKTLEIELTPGTLNMGSEYIKSSLLVNSKGLILGKGSGGPEIANADNAFRN